jgi:hypothetical protein
VSNPWRTSDMSAAHVEIERPKLYVFEKRITSHITARFNRLICARTVFRLGGPYARHFKEMPLQSRAMNVAHQLHALCCQARALKLMLSQVVRLGHSAPP